MVSRRRILSRSRDELHMANEEEPDDVWVSKESLYRDHIQEVMDKWLSIDDEIWAKLIVLERNRRVAKAYARAPVLTVNGSDDGFDGFRIGVGGFDNPMRDAQTREVIRHIGQGFKLKMDDVGNILIKRISKAPVRIKNTNEESAVSNDILKLPGGLLEVDKPFKVFDMKKFQQNMSRELKRPYPDRRKLESQCISAVAFGNGGADADDEDEVLGCPIWVLCINIVAIEMLRSKLPPLAPRMRPRSLEPRSLPPQTMSTTPPSSSSSSSSSNNNKRNLGGGGGKKHLMMMRSSSSGRFGMGLSTGSSDEDPYSVAGGGGNGSSGSGSGSPGSAGSGGNGGSKVRARSQDKPPKLPPRDNGTLYPRDGGIWSKTSSNQQQHRSKGKDKRPDDPYYCGLRARIPNFVRSKKSSSKQQSHKESKTGPVSLPPQMSTPHPFWWHSRLYNDSAPSAGPMSLVSSDHQTTSTSGSSAAHQQQQYYQQQQHQMMLARSGGGGGYRRNPTNFVPYNQAVTDSSDSDYSHIYGRMQQQHQKKNLVAAGTSSRVRKFPTKPMFMSQWE